MLYALGSSHSFRIRERRTLRSWPKVPPTVMFFASTRSRKGVFGSLPTKELYEPVALQCY
jgi:hypothetical protein